MSAHDLPRPVEKPNFFTPGTLALVAIMALGAAFGLWRYISGLEPVTNLTNTYPWGIWKAINVAAIAAYGSSGFTLTFIIHVLNKEKYHSLMRPGLIVGLLCYTFVGIALIVDIGKYYDIWHPLWPTMWQGNSALFEVAMCVMCYLTVLYIEFAPLAFERFIGKVNLPGALAGFNKLTEGILKLGRTVLGRTMGIFMALGITLCCLHQATLGTLMVITQGKLHGLWWTQALPLLFLSSAAAVGLCSAVVASLWSSKAFGLKYEMKAITSLARSIPIVIAFYAALRIIDLALRDSLGLMFEGSGRSYMFLVEFFIGVILPMIIFLFQSARKSPRAMFFASFLFMLGIGLNRVNTYLTGYMPYNANGAFYFPTFAEIIICVAQIAAIIFLYRLIAYIFPVMSQPAKEEEPAQAGAKSQPQPA
ncbi:MAG TPA: Ni/Fe-hydrogenase cytochrome b subunit [bacterium]|nr:Ni/Fe-hydrogenase cytochrome b subunit [bacterium]